MNESQYHPRKRMGSNIQFILTPGSDCITRENQWMQIAWKISGRYALLVNVLNQKKEQFHD